MSVDIEISAGPKVIGIFSFNNKKLKKICFTKKIFEYYFYYLIPQVQGICLESKINLFPQTSPKKFAASGSLLGDI